MVYNINMSKMYKYETHLHTYEGSACASTTGSDYIIPYVNAGYSGLIVTDHFWGGNTRVEREQPWENWVNLFCSGYEKALQAAQEYNRKNNTTGTEQSFQVFFGFEQSFDGDDYLIYGLDKNWLLAHPEVVSMSHQQLFQAVNEANGMMIQAHPFRLRDYMKAIHIHPRDVHGVEVYNAGNRPEENFQAELYAKIYDFPVTSGSDMHHKENVQITLSPLSENSVSPNHLGGMAFETPLNSIQDYCRLVKSRNGTIIK